ncbi:MAG: NUDIX domain-containing protein [Candidatus Rifleibacteriota bacterium]
MKKKIKNKNQTAFALPGKPLRTSAKAIIVENEKILTTRNKDLFGNFYLLPGGGQEHGETLTEALKRECYEETGVTIKVGELVLIREYISANHEFAEYNPDIHQIEFFFKCTITGRAKDDFIPNADCMQTGVSWLPIKELKNFRLYPKTFIELLQKHSDLNFPTIYLGDTN